MNQQYVFNPLPKGNLNDLAYGIEQALQQISMSLNLDSVKVLPVLNKEPGYVVDGMLCICDGTNWNPLGDGIKRAVIRVDGIWKGVS
jgi:hypothetical protein